MPPLFRPFTAEWVGAAFAPEAARTPAQTAALSFSDNLIAELLEADEYVIGVPMHNFSVSSALKLWIDQITRVDKTFSYATGAPRGLISGKKATFVIASGAFYDAGTQLASYNFVEAYLRVHRCHRSHFSYYWRNHGSQPRSGSRHILRTAPQSRGQTRQSGLVSQLVFSKRDVTTTFLICGAEGLYPRAKEVG